MEGILVYIFSGAVGIAVLSSIFAAFQSKRYASRVKSIEERRALLSNSSVDERLAQIEKNKHEVSEPG